MSPETFLSLVAILEHDPTKPQSAVPNNPIFFKPIPRPPGRPDTPLPIQLASFLRSTARCTHVSAAQQTSTGEGSSYNHSTNIIAALLNLQQTYVKLPSTFEEKKVSSDGFGFVGAMGAIDGTLFRLKNQPRDNPAEYYCRKKFWGVRGLTCSVPFVPSYQPD